MSIQNKRARSSAEESELVLSALTCYHILLFVHSFSSNVVLACFGRTLYITFSGSYLGNNFEGGGWERLILYDDMFKCILYSHTIACEQARRKGKEEGGCACKPWIFLHYSFQLIIIRIYAK